MSLFPELDSPKMYDDTMDVARALEVERLTMEARRVLHDFLVEMQENNPYHPQLNKIVAVLSANDTAIQMVMYSIERGKQTVRATRAETAVEQGQG